MYTTKTIDKMDEQTLIKKWEVDCDNFLKGKIISNVRYLTRKEMEQFGWYRRSLAIFFTDGSYIIPSSDDEGNDAGALFTSDKNLPTIPVI